MWRRLQILLTLIALVFVVGTRGAGLWFCEGQTCSGDLWNCCCVAPASPQDPYCNQPRMDVPLSNPCPTECNCVFLELPRALARGMGAGLTATMYADSTGNVPLYLMLDLLESTARSLPELALAAKSQAICFTLSPRAPPTPFQVSSYEPEI